MAAEAQRQARHDNDMIYTEKVPQITELPPIKGHAMVKPIRVDELDVPDPPVLAPPPEVAREPSVPTAAPAARKAGGDAGRADGGALGRRRRAAAAVV